MDKYETRRLNLQALMKAHCDGKPASLAARMTRAPSYVSRMLYEEGKPGKRRIGEDMAEVIERVFDLPKGGLDQRLREPLSAGNSPQLRSEGWSELTRVDAAEHYALSLIRRTDDRGRAEMLAALEEIANGQALNSQRAPTNSADSIRRKRVTDSKTHQIGLVNLIPRKERDKE